MGKNLYIAEKPSVGQSFAKALNMHPTEKHNGYIEDENNIVTWCRGHLVTMSYPEVYDAKLKDWTIETLPFIPNKYIYEVIPEASEQFKIVKGLLNRKDIQTIYNCGDSAREGEYIQRLTYEKAGWNTNARMMRVWIDSQTDEEILRGIREALPSYHYDNLSRSAYMRAIEDYLIGINLSRIETLLYAQNLKNKLNLQKCSISVGRVMTCVLGMIVQREQEIKNFKVTPYYGLKAKFEGMTASWKITDDSMFFESPLLYNETGFVNKDDATSLMDYCKSIGNIVLGNVENKTEKKYAPLLYNLAELQSDCSNKLKISPDDTLNALQGLYEGKMVTYPRTDARVLSTAISKEIEVNIRGLKTLYPQSAQFVDEILSHNAHKNIASSKYCDDSKISDHYAIIPTGKKDSSFSPSELQMQIYDMIVKRFLSIFYPCAIFTKCTADFKVDSEHFFAHFTGLNQLGYLTVTGYDKEKNENELITKINSIPVGTAFSPVDYEITENETKPPSRYSSGSIILAMENAGKLIEEEELREQIKDCGIGTSATRGEILKKLTLIGYINLNKSTQILTPTSLGTEVCRVVANTIPTLLSPKMTANWEQGLSKIADGSLSYDSYYQTLTQYVANEVNKLKENAPEIEVISKPDNKAMSQNIMCPICKKGYVRMNSKALYCTCYKEGCKFTIWRKQFGKELTDKNLADLITSGQTGKIKFKKKDGTEYTASLIYEKGEVKFAPRK